MYRSPLIKTHRTDGAPGTALLSAYRQSLEELCKAASGSQHAAKNRFCPSGMYLTGFLQWYHDRLVQEAAHETPDTDIVFSCIPLLAHEQAKNSEPDKKQHLFSVLKLAYTVIERYNNRQ
jgi:hypothetical protein